MASRVSHGTAGREGPGRPGAACRASPGQLPWFSLSGDEQGKADNLALGPERLALSQAPSHTDWTRLLFPPSVQFFTNAYGARATRQATTDQGTSPRPRGPTATAAAPRQSNVNRCGKCVTAGLTHQLMKSLIFDGFTEAKEVEQGSGKQTKTPPRKVGGEENRRDPELIGGVKPTQETPVRSWVRKIHHPPQLRRRKWQPTPALLPGKSHRQTSLEGYSPWVCKKPDKTGRLNSSKGLAVGGCPPWTERHPWAPRPLWTPRPWRIVPVWSCEHKQKKHSILVLGNVAFIKGKFKDEIPRTPDRSEAAVRPQGGGARGRRTQN